MTKKNQSTGGHTDNGLKIRCWNIQHRRCSTLGQKTELSEFAKILTASNIFCLQETKGEIFLPEYKCQNKLRRPSSSGGLCIGYHRSLTPGCSNFQIPESPDIQGIKLDKRFFGLQRSIILLNIYNSPENSSYKASKENSGVTTLDLLTEVLNRIPNDCDTVLAGDFNSRIAELPDFIVNETFSNTGSVVSNEPPSRTSKDKSTNPNGKPFIELLTTHELTTLNGRTLGDLSGEFTCLKYNGSSVVDYIAVSKDIASSTSVRHFKVLPFTPFSDHKPLEICLETGRLRNSHTNPSLTHLEDQQPGFKWEKKNNKSKTEFIAKQKLAGHLKDIEDMHARPIKTREDVYKLNNDISQMFIRLAGSVLKQKKVTPATNNHKWFDFECRNAKRDRNRLLRSFSIDPLEETTRAAYYAAEKNYKMLKKSKKGNFLRNLNQDIEEGNAVNWTAFKKLKSTTHKDENAFDCYDMANFYEFFKDLYSKNKQLTKEKVTDFRNDTAQLQEDLSATLGDELEDLLNSPITEEELTAAIKRLKGGKSTSEDCILNEMIQNSTVETTSILLKLFNGCLENGTYPWNTSLMTTLHKKGDRYDPNNFRSICVGSNLGKVFSDISLQRLIAYRNIHCRDPPNQLGFVRNAQTSDHILTLSSIVDKYCKKSKKKLYTCFVDYRKAFDTVCREALLYKLSQLGVKGKYFACLKHMYENSSTKIKLIKKLSEKIDILVGTEQGHVMSPELFKIFILGLTELLNEHLENCPELNGFSINHLLWADDLVLMALDPITLQLLINVLHEFCQDWGLEVNQDKTQVMIFNKAGRSQEKHHKFTLGGKSLQHATTYCYLGMVFTLSGSWQPTMEDRRKKTLKAYFNMKKTVDQRHLSYKAINTLYDTLVKPVLTYGCQVWLPSTNLVKHLTREAPANPTEVLKKIAGDEAEKTHLRYIKWTLGTHKKTSTIGSWGDSGRPPILLSVINQTLDYFKRARDADPSSLLYHTYQDQKNLQLDWHRGITNMINNFGNHNHQADPDFSNQDVLTNMLETFIETWKIALSQSKKLVLYQSLKDNFGAEPYLHYVRHQHRSSLTKLRLSSHPLAIETGRYAPHEGTFARRCRLCAPDVEDIRHLPFFDPIVEDEFHMLVACPLYHDLRLRLPEEVLSHLLQHDLKSIFHSNQKIKSLAIYTTAALRRRREHKSFGANTST